MAGPGRAKRGRERGERVDVLERLAAIRGPRGIPVPRENDYIASDRDARFTDIGGELLVSGS